MGQNFVAFSEYLNFNYFCKSLGKIPFLSSFTCAYQVANWVSQTWGHKACHFLLSVKVTSLIGHKHSKEKLHCIYVSDLVKITVGECVILNFI